MARADFDAVLSDITRAIAGKPVDPSLQAFLSEHFPPDGDAFRTLFDACRAGLDEGWLCAREHGGIRFGRVVEAGEQTAGFSVDVVHMDDVKGPYHRHPNGEIDMIMPLDDEARFDGEGAGWLVYGPDSAHFPTVTGGAALVLYLLPEGAIDFKAKPPSA